MGTTVALFAQSGAYGRGSAQDVVTLEAISAAVAIGAFLVLCKLVFVGIYQCVPAFVAKPHVIVHRVESLFGIFLWGEVAVIFLLVEFSHGAASQFAHTGFVAKMFEPPFESEIEKYDKKRKQKATG